MMKKIPLFLLLFLIIYSFLIQKNELGEGVIQNQRHGNSTKLYELLHQKEQLNSIFVGSSIGVRLPLQRYDSTLFNFSLGGLSLFDGLQTIIHHHIHPNRIIIELNVIERGLNSSFQNESEWYKKAPFFADFNIFNPKYQPMGIVGNWVGDALFGKVFYKSKLVLKGESKPESRLKEQESQLDLQKEWINAEKPKNVSHSDSLLIENRVKQLVSTLKIIQPDQVIFVFVPTDVSNFKKIREEFIKETVEKYMASDFQYQFYEHQLNTTYKTTDGVHLNPESATSFAQEMIEFLSTQ